MVQPKAVLEKLIKSKVKKYSVSSVMVVAFRALLVLYIHPWQTIKIYLSSYMSCQSCHTYSINKTITTVAKRLPIQSLDKALGRV